MQVDKAAVVLVVARFAHGARRRRLQQLSLAIEVRQLALGFGRGHMHAVCKIRPFIEISTISTSQMVIQ